MHQLPKFYHPILTHSEVIVLTNTQTHKQTDKHTDAAENIQCSSIRYDVEYIIIYMYIIIILSSRVLL